MTLTRLVRFCSALGVALTFAACSDDDSPSTPATNTSSTGTAATMVTASPTSAAPPTQTALPTPSAPKLQVTGLFSGEPPIGSQPVANTRSLGSRPESAFPAWDSTQAVIFDTATNRAIEIGYASHVVFSPDSTRAAWIPTPSTGPATVMNLTTGEIRTYADGTNVGFLDNKRLAIHQSSSSSWKVVDVDTGQVSADQSLRLDQAQPGFPSYPRSPLGYYWTFTPDPASALPRGWAGKNDFRLIEIASGQTALRFDAVFAAAAGPNEIVVGTPVEGAMTNIFIVNIQTGKAEFIARTRYGQGPNWPLSATARYVLWTDNFCYSEGVNEQGRMQLFDRDARTLTDIEDGVSPADPRSDRYAVLTPGNLLAWGSFGARALIDPTSLTYTTVLPDGGDRLWSPDYRYASYGLAGGHGGLC